MNNQQTGETGATGATAAKGGSWELFFVENMRRLRESSGMTQTDLAKKLRARGLPFHQQTIQRVENGDRPLRLNEAFAICEEFGVDLDTMVSHSITDAEEVSVHIQQLSEIGTNTAYALAEAYTAFNEGIEEFGRSIYPIIPPLTDWKGKTSTEIFTDLPYSSKLGIAVCWNILQLGQDLGRMFTQFGEFFGDRKAEHRPDLWRFPMPDTEETFSWLSFWEFDCEELQALTRHHLSWLFVEALRDGKKSKSDSGGYMGEAKTSIPPTREPGDSDQRIDGEVD